MESFIKTQDFNDILKSWAVTGVVQRTKKSVANPFLKSHIERIHAFPMYRSKSMIILGNVVTPDRQTERQTQQGATKRKTECERLQCTD